MTGPEHYEESERLLNFANEHTCDEAVPGYRFAEVVAEAQVHATLALFDRIQEIGDQLDTLPRKSGILTDDDVMRCGHGAVICGLCGYGVPAGDGGRS